MTRPSLPEKLLLVVTLSLLLFSAIMFGCCCNPCPTITIDLWENLTRVRRAAFTNGVDASGGLTITEAVPFSRYNSAQYAQDNDPNDCNDLPPGECGSWLFAGEWNGLSSQTVEDTVNDILACAEDDATHAKVDNNCYVKSGLTQSYPPTIKHGCKFVLAKKNWHGAFGWNDNDACDQDPNIAPSQTRYLTFTPAINYHFLRTQYQFLYDEGTGTWSPNGSLEENETTTAVTGSRSVNRYSGVITSTVSVTEDQYAGLDCDGDGTFAREHTKHIEGCGGWLQETCGSNQLFYKTGLTSSIDADLHAFPYCLTDLPMIQTLIDQWNYLAGLAGWDEAVPEKTLTGWTLTVTATVTELDGSTRTNSLTITITRSGTVYDFDVDYDVSTVEESSTIREQVQFYGTLTLSDPYTAEQWYADWRAALAAWNMDDDQVYPWRTDEQLANGPLCIYDELPPTSPVDYACATMDDYSTRVNDKNGNAPGSVASGNNDDFGFPPSSPYYSGGVDYILTWNQIPWQDTRNYIWKYGASYIQPDPLASTWGGATLVSGLYSGAIIGHNPAGYARHFSFPYVERERRQDVNPESACNGQYHWLDITHGAFSQSPLPAATLRWMDKIDAQYDSGLCCSDGIEVIDCPARLTNFPQAFLSTRNGQMRGGKYVEVKEDWPKVNFARPCGVDRFDVDQTTVCCVLSTGTGTFTVKRTGNAILPLASGGLQVGDKIIVKADGVYAITALTDDGEIDDGLGNVYEQFTITVGPKIDDLPTGGILFGDARDDVNWLGRARWWDNAGKKAPGICGRVAITTAFSDPTLTITPTTVSLPYVRTGDVVDICASDMTVLASAVTLTRVDDSTFTTVHADVVGAAWLVPHVLYDGFTPGTKYYFSNTTPARTFVQLEWEFDKRKLAAESVVASLIAASDPGAGAAQTAFEATYGSYPPTWYAEIGGCTGLTVTQPTIPVVACNPAVVGTVPSGVEVFGSAVLAGFPATFTVDDVYGAHWQAAVETTMVDPFWQTPFKPDCDILSPDSMTWSEDDGSGQEDYEEITESLATIYHKFYAHAPLVEALSDYPSEGPVPETVPTLPTGLSLTFDLDLNDITPPYYPNGIPIGDAAGNYASIWRPYGLYNAACANIALGGRFSGDYSEFVSC